MIIKTSIQEERPEFYKLVKGDIIKVHTPNFGNLDYNRQFMELGENAEYLVTEADRSRFVIYPVAGGTLRYPKLKQRDSNSGYPFKFGGTYSLVRKSTAIVDRVKDFR